jgi:hypothetical protein
VIFSRLLVPGFCHCSLDSLWSHRKLEETNPCGIEDSIGNHSPHADNGRLPSSLWRNLRVLHQNGFQLRQPGETRDFIGVEVEILD